MTFAIQVRDWLIRVVWVGINQSRTRIVKNIINSENCYVIYLLRIIDIQIYFVVENIEKMYLLFLLFYSCEYFIFRINPSYYSHKILYIFSHTKISLFHISFGSVKFLYKIVYYSIGLT